MRLKNILLFLLAFSLPLTSNAVSLKLKNYGEVFIQNLGVNQEYNISKIANLPLVIENNNDHEINVEIQILKPTVFKTKPNFESIPDETWLKGFPTTLTVPANGSKQMEVLLKIPNDESLRGKKFHADINARIVPHKDNPAAITIATTGHFLFSIAATKALEGKIPPKNVNLNFTIFPARIFMQNVALKTKTELKTDKNTFPFIENNSKEKITFTIQSVNPKDTPLKIRDGFEATPSPELLVIKNDEITIKPGQKKPIKAYINIPNEEKYKNKRFEFLINVTSGVYDSSKYLPVSIITTGK